MSTHVLIDRQHTPVMTQPMRPIYFDISDIVEYATHSRRVTGIQRVQIKLIDCLSRQHPDEPIYCTFIHPSNQTRYATRALSLFSGPEFNAGSLLAKLNLNRGLIPHKHEIKHVLRPYDRQKIRRSIKKLGIYVAALTAPHKLEAMGFTPRLRGADARQTPLRPLPQLEPDSVLAYIGANWGRTIINELGVQHVASGGDVVQLIYDLIPALTPQYCPPGFPDRFVEFLNHTLQHATRYLSISNWTRQDMNVFLQSKGRSMTVTTLPLAHELDGYARNEQHTAPDNTDLLSYKSKPFVLCVGTLEIRKNGLGLLKAWNTLRLELGHHMPTLVFAGKPAWLIDDFMSMLQDTPGLSDVVKIVATPSDRDLAFLYQNCLFTAYPSFYEGWGLPLGEAAWFGKFCVASCTTSMPEVLGDLADYVDPCDPADMVAKLKRAIVDPEHVKRKEAAIRHAPLRSWQDVADDLYFQLNRRA